MPTAESDMHAHVSSASDRVLRLLRYVGLIGFLGGLAALSAMWAFGPVPQNVEQWHMLIALVKSIFFACSFSGIVILIVVGGISWWKHRAHFHRASWFRVMMISLVITIPAFHFWARSTAEKLYTVIEHADENQAQALEDAARIWDQLGASYVTALAILLGIAAIGITKPSFGERDEPSE
jgi:hypothetical protein